MSDPKTTGKILTATSAWVITRRDAAEQMAEQTGRAVVWVSDATYGFARLLRDGETAEQAVADFEAAGERAVRSEIYE